MHAFRMNETQKEKEGWGRGIQGETEGGEFGSEPEYEDGNGF